MAASIPPRSRAQSAAPGGQHDPEKIVAQLADDEVLIGQAAEATGLTMRALRYYDTEGLVVPSGRSAGGYRLYSAADLRRLQWLKPLTGMGMHREDIIRTLDLLEAAHQQTNGAGAPAPANDSSILGDRRHLLLLDAVRARRRALAQEMSLLDHLIGDLAIADPVDAGSRSTFADEEPDRGIAEGPASAQPRIG
jgi:MerR family transcriptional regulator, copper efflux regulator